MLKRVSVRYAVSHECCAALKRDAVCLHAGVMTTILTAPAWLIYGAGGDRPPVFLTPYHMAVNCAVVFRSAFVEFLKLCRLQKNEL